MHARKALLLAAAVAALITGCGQTAPGPTGHTAHTTPAAQTGPAHAQTGPAAAATCATGMATNPNAILRDGPGRWTGQLPGRNAEPDQA
jgi:hypothetical protein